MSKFTRNFICRMALFWGILTILSYTFLKMFTQKIVLEIDKSENFSIYLVFILYGIINLFIVLLLAKIFTKSMRIKGCKSYPQDEFSFYRNFILAMTVLNILFAVIIFKASQTDFLTAFEEARKKIYIQQYEKNYYENLLNQLENVRLSAVNSQRTALIIECVLQSVAMFFAATKLVKIYQSPNK